MATGARQRKAQLRLQRDLRELAERAWELPTVSALPLEDNIMEWHCNIVGDGDHEGVVLHLKLLFPDTYPHQPPEVVLMSRVCHPHVFGDHVCLDMLEEGQWSDSHEREAEFTGWSNCYSVFSILMQLQAFLFDLGNNARRTRLSAQRCECFCGHGLHRVYPPLPTPLPPPPRPPVAHDPFEWETISSTRVEDEDEVQGTVTRVEHYGVFVTLHDGKVGLLHRSETPRGRTFEIGDTLSCRVKTNEPKLSLTLLRSESELQAMAMDKMPIPATVTNVKPFGAFVDLGGFSALLHRSEADLVDGQRVPWEIGEMLSVRLIDFSAPKLAVTTKPLYLLPSQPRQMRDGDVDLARLCCFHSKEAYGEAVLGVGVSLEAEEGLGSQPKHHLTSIYDVLAHGSFQDGVRRGVWKQKFFAFLPLAIDSEHFERARIPFQESVAKLASGVVAEKTRSHGKSREEREEEYASRITLEEYRSLGKEALQRRQPASMCRPTGSLFVPEMIFEVIPKLMNSQVVLLSSGQLWRCQKALEGYFAYHHLLLHCMRAYPVLRVELEKKLQAFFLEPKAREKSQVHNIGEFICLLSVSDEFDWDKLGVLILEEVFDRNALWVLKQAPNLGDLGASSVHDQVRLRTSFRATIVSLRLLMFQVAFLQLVKPPHVHGPGCGLCSAASCALDRKDRCKGIPSPGEAEWLFDRCLEILSVEDYDGFLALVGAAPMTTSDVARWLRRSVLRSTEKGYHNPAIFRSIVRKAAEAKQPVAGEADPEDFAVDNRSKESKADKRARKRAALLARAAVMQRQSEYQRALTWARFYSPQGYRPRQCVTWVFGQSDAENLLSVMDSEGKLQERCNQALPGYRLLDGMTKDKLEKVKKFPIQVWLGRGCVDCGAAVCCEISGRCMTCCHRAAKEPMAAKPIKGLTGHEAPTANFTVFQSMAEMRPVQFEIQYEVPFDGLVADISGLRAALSEDLVVKEKLQGGTVFSLVSRCGKKLWEKSPEQSIFPGSKLTAGWQGVTDSIFEAKIRNFKFVLLQQTMYDMKSREDLGLLKMTRSFCKDHSLEAVVMKVGMCNINYKAVRDEGSLSTFRDTLKDIFRRQAEIADSSLVEIAVTPLKDNDLSVQVTVVPPTGMLPSMIMERLSCPEIIRKAVVIAASKLKGQTAAVVGVSPAKIVKVRPESFEDPHMVTMCRQRPCQNCRGVLRLRFNAPDRFVERRAQLEDLSNEQLMQRAQLCGLAETVEANGATPEGRKTSINLIIKSEGIIR
jgi:ubiquitin-protein ligase/predicted RNA-binding protein with RPS1 domain